MVSRMQTTLGVSDLDSVKAVLVKIVQSATKKNKIDYLDVRLEAGEGVGSYVEDTTPKQTSKDWRVSLGIRVMLGAILLASFVSRFIFKKIRIMQMPKMALSMFVVSFFIITTLALCAIFGILDVRNLSIFPILLFILLSDRIVALFLERPLQETFTTTIVTLILGILGYTLLAWEAFRSLILLYPELILLLIPLNILIGRYFGLRVTEYIKFRPVLKHGNK